MTEIDWASELGLDPSIELWASEYGTFHVGDLVTVIQDNEDVGYYERDTGIVLGFSQRGPALNAELAIAFGNDPRGGTDMYVELDNGMDPVAVRFEDVE